ncbi:hypothetical protein ABZ348_12835 [Streptomyces sp. NPDC005963]|uniref:hypothetical protein n=1 Tax=Streptomyces sp. NPDC005963 TaxID=3156721 RepID=UPI0034012A81
MDLTPYVEGLRRDFLAAAKARGEETRAVGEELIAAFDSSVRLTLLQALSDAAEEITGDLVPGSVEVRLRGVDLRFVVIPPPTEPLLEDDETGYGDPSPPTESGGEPARITFRPSEGLKAQVEEAASLERLSVNAWLVRTVTAALRVGSRRPERRGPPVNKRYTGWAR